MIEARVFGEVVQFIMGRLMGEKPVFTMACYYVDGLLIDTGPFHVAEEIEEAFVHYPVQTIVNTHHHEDHISNNVVFQERLGVGPALAHELAVPRIVDPGPWASRLIAYQHLVWGAPPPSKAVKIGPKVETDKYSLDVIYTPGHSDDHIVLLEPTQGWLFAGDLFITEKLVTVRNNEKVNEILVSLHKLLDYQFETLFCSSGQVLENAREAIIAKIEYWETLREQVYRLHREGLEPEIIRERLLGRETSLCEPTEGVFSKINLIKSFLS